MTFKDALSGQDMLKEIGRVGGYADGNYMARCRECERVFIGDKRAMQCLLCATKSATSEIERLTNTLAEIAKQKLRAEMHGDVLEGVNADWEHGYECCVRRAREALGMS